MNKKIFAISPLRIVDKNDLMSKLSEQQRHEGVSKYKQRLNNYAVEVEFISGMYVVTGNIEYYYATTKLKPPLVNIKIAEVEISKITANLLLRANKEILNPMMSALIYLELKEIGGLSQQQIAKKINKSSGAISNKMRLLKLPEVVQAEIIKQTIKERHGRAILQLAKLDDYEVKASFVLNEILKNHFKVAETENLVYSLLGKKIINHHALNIKKLDGRQELKHPEVGMVISKVSSEIEQTIKSLHKFFPNLEIAVADGIDKEDYVFLLKLKGINK